MRWLLACCGAVLALFLAFQVGALVGASGVRRGTVVRAHPFPGTFGPYYGHCHETATAWYCAEHAAP